MSRFEITGRKPGPVSQQGEAAFYARGPPQLTVAAFTIEEFCHCHRISKTLFYELRRRGLAPDVAELLGKKIITHESAAKWRKERTAASKKSGLPLKGTSSPDAA
jgi:hypothetical protein